MVPRTRRTLTLSSSTRAQCFFVFLNADGFRPFPTCTAIRKQQPDQSQERGRRVRLRSVRVIVVAIDPRLTSPINR